MSLPSASPGAATAPARSEGSPRRPLLTVVVPVYNGGDEIVHNLTEIQRAVNAGLGGEQVEMIVVSDGSIDDTAERLLAARTDADLRVIHYDRNLGKGYAVKTGALASHGAWVALVDADLDIDPSSIPEYVTIARDERLDFAIGSKRHPDSVVVYPRSRQVASWCYQQLNRVLFRLDVRDTQVGLKVFSRRVVDDVVPLLLVKRFAFDLELLAVAAALGYRRVRELPIRLDYGFTGSELRSRAVVRALLDTAAVFYRLRILRTYQRKRQLLRGASALPSDQQPLVSVLGPANAAVRLDYPKLEVLDAGPIAESAGVARGEVVAVLAEDARPAGNWVTAAVPYFADADVAAVVAPALTPPQASLRERAAAAVLESRLGGGSRRSRYFPGNVRVVEDQPAAGIIVRRADLLSAASADVPMDALVSWLAAHGRRTIYTPDTSIAVPPPRLLRPHLEATFVHATMRGVAARRARGASVSAATAFSLLPLACALVGCILVAAGAGTVRVVGIGLVAAYGVTVIATAALAALRFRSLRVGLLAVPSLVLTQGTYVAGFLDGFVRGR